MGTDNDLYPYVCIYGVSIRFWVQGLGFRGLGIGVYIGLEFWVSLWFRVQGLGSMFFSGFRVQGSGFVWAGGFRVQGLRFWVEGLRFRVQGLGFRFQGFISVSGLGFRVSGFGFRAPTTMNLHAEILKIVQQIMNQTQKNI